MCLQSLQKSLTSIDQIVYIPDNPDSPMLIPPGTFDNLIIPDQYRSDRLHPDNPDSPMLIPPGTFDNLIIPDQYRSDRL